MNMILDYDFTWLGQITLEVPPRLVDSSTISAARIASMHEIPHSLSGDAAGTSLRGAATNAFVGTLGGVRSANSLQLS